MRVVPASDRGRLLVASVITLGIVGTLGWMWWSSLLPDTYDIAEMGYADYGGGVEPSTGMSDHSDGTPVAELLEVRTGAPDHQVTLTVHDDGDRITVNGQTPGPTLEFRKGDLVEVTLVNDNVAEGATLHWHGLDVPNAVDGVAGVTQDAVLPGESFVYRFVADQIGTYWYHSHQVSHVQVRRGLLGALVVKDERGGAERDVVAVQHHYDGVATINGAPGTSLVPAQPGETVRVRVVNTDNSLTSVWVTGAPFEVVAVDGIDLHGPTPVEDRFLTVTAGGRADLRITVPPGGARIDLSGTSAVVLGRDPTDGAPPKQPTEELDLLSYGAPTATGLDVTEPDRYFEYRIGRRPGFLDGKPGVWWTINGHMYPDVPMFMVSEGDVVVMRLENHTGDSHPMHLHGHHALVLSRDDVAATGSPLWVDSIEVAPGETWEIAFRADNPGIWMDHCHNLPHAVEGLVAHLMYTGVSSSFKVGSPAGNQPE